MLTSSTDSKADRASWILRPDALLESEVRSEEELIERYQEIEHSFMGARKAALRNTQLYLSMANDLDVYVATSMRSRQQFRKMAQTCELIFSHPASSPPPSPALRPDDEQRRAMKTKVLSNVWP